MKKKQDFTEQETAKFTGIIGGIDTTDTSDTTTTESTQKSRAGRRAYNKLNPNEEPPAEYRFTARMPGEYGLYLQEKAWRERSTITEVIAQLVKADMDAHPEIIETLDALNKK